MPMTVVITRDVADRFRGFLGSIMLEVAAGTYISPDMNAAVRVRMWTVMEDWFSAAGTGSLLLLWQDRQSTGGIGLKALGAPAYELVGHEGTYLLKRETRI